MSTTVPERWSAESWEESMRSAVADGVILYPFTVGAIEAFVADRDLSDAEKLARIREVLAARSRVEVDPTGQLYSRPANGDGPQQVGPRVPLHTGAVTDVGLVDQTGLDEVPDEQLRETVHWADGPMAPAYACGATSGLFAHRNREKVTCPACLHAINAPEAR